MIKLLTGIAGMNSDQRPFANKAGDLVDQGPDNNSRMIDAGFAEEATEEDIAAWNEMQDREAEEKAERIKVQELDNKKRAEAEEKALKERKTDESSDQKKRRKYRERMDAEEKKFRVERAKEKREEKEANDAALKKKNAKYTKQKLARLKTTKSKEPVKDASKEKKVAA